VYIEIKTQVSCYKKEKVKGTRIMKVGLAITNVMGIFYSLLYKVSWQSFLSLSTCNLELKVELPVENPTVSLTM
jgi:hypothetical protein